MPDLDALDVISNETYELNGYPHDAWTRLRREAPIRRFAPEGGVKPFWAITKHADVVAISKNPTVFQNAPRLGVFPGLEPFDDEPPPARHLINMDPPEHGRFRRLVSSRFAPRAAAAARRAESSASPATCSTSSPPTDASARPTLYRASPPPSRSPCSATCSAPRARIGRKLFQWTNETIGANDPEFQQHGETAADTADRSRSELFQYFWQMVEARRARADGRHRQRARQRARSTASTCRRSSCSRTASCWSSPATRPRATPRAAALLALVREPRPSWRSCAATRR